MKEIEIIENAISHNLEKVLNFWQSFVNKWTTDWLLKKMRSYNAINLQSDRSKLQAIQYLSKQLFYRFFLYF
jgi:hypothetical protein